MFKVCLLVSICCCVKNASSECQAVTLGCVPAEPAGLKSFVKAELNLINACSKEGEPKPSALLCCVLQALAIQGDLQRKIKLFSKQCDSVFTVKFFIYISITFLLNSCRNVGTVPMHLVSTHSSHYLDANLNTKNMYTK